MRVKGLDFKDCSHDIELVAIKYLFSAQFSKSFRALTKNIFELQ